MSSYYTSPDHPYHKALEEAGHKLILDEDGEIDIFRLAYHVCNGPECELCGEAWCQHCQNKIEECKGKNI